MKARCTNPNDAFYPEYGGRGITFDPRWSDFETFLAEMGERPPGTTLDRLDSNLGYSRSNCRWADAIQQSRNKRSNRRITIHGVEMLMIEAVEMYGHSYGLLHDRIVRRGWSPEKAVSTPIDVRKRNRRHV